ncbi:V-type ATP synthase subunit F [Stetteria hydrogenophila]
MQRGGGKLVVIGDRDTLPLFRTAGLSVAEARSTSDVLKVIREKAGEAALFIVLRHVVDDEEALRREAAKLGAQVLILASKWAPAKPLRVQEMLAKALGVG